MKRCNYCFRYALGQPTYCAHCGRTYGVRICSRGHVLSRDMQFCPTCGSHDLSTPAPPESILGWFSRWTLQMLVGGFVLLIVVSLILAVLAQINWQALIDPFVRLALMLALLYWATTLLPGPIKKVGRTAGRQVMKTMTRRRNRD